MQVELTKIQASNIEGKLEYGWNMVTNFKLSLSRPLGEKNPPGRGLEIFYIEAED